MRPDERESAEETILSAALREAYPAGPGPTLDLQVRVQGLVIGQQRQRRQRRALRLGASLASLAAVAGMALVWLSPPGVAQRLERALSSSIRQRKVATRERLFDATGNLASTEMRWGRFGEETPLSRVERRDARGEVVSLEIWRGTSRWSQPFVGAPLRLSEQAAFEGDFRPVTFGGRWLSPHRDRLGIVEGRGTSAGGRRCRTLTVGEGGSRQVYYLDVETGRLLQRDEEERSGASWRLRRRLEVSDSPTVPDTLFAAPGSGASRESQLAVLRERLSRPLARWESAGRQVALHDVFRNARGEVFALYGDTRSPGAELSVSGPGAGYLSGPGFSVSLEGFPVVLEGRTVRGRWFLPRGEGRVSGPVRLGWRGRSVWVTPTALTASVPDYGGLLSADFGSSLGYLRGLLGSSDARSRRDARLLLSVADESLATFSSLPPPYRDRLRALGLLDRSFALRVLGDGRGAHAALAEARHVLGVDADPFALSRARSWSSP